MKKYLLVLGLSVTLTGYGTTIAPVVAENADYRVIDAHGIVVTIKPKNIENSTYRYDFTINFKKAKSVASVRIERQNKNNTKTLLIDDSANKTKAGKWQKQQPSGARSYLYGEGIGHIVWKGQSPSFSMTKEQAPWLYSSGNTRKTFLITITDLQGKKTTLKQHMVIPSKHKQIILKYTFM